MGTALSGRTQLCPLVLLCAKGAGAEFGSVVLLFDWTCLKTEICIKRAVTSPAPSFRYCCIDVSNPPHKYCWQVVSQVQETFLQKVFLGRGKKNPYIN